MYLAELSIKNFRRLSSVSVKFSPGLNVLVGPNNIGKTAIVDALIFVEGAAELMMINLLARRCGADLRDHAVSLISVVGGSEPFLKSFKVFDGDRSHDIGDLNAKLSASGFEFECVVGHASVSIPLANAVRSITKLGKVGA
jgi:predicted ATP-dependent endonuclease of OLD family